MNERITVERLHWCSRAFSSRPFPVGGVRQPASGGASRTGPSTHAVRRAYGAAMPEGGGTEARADDGAGS